MCWIDGIFEQISRRTFVYVYVPGNVSGGKHGDTTQRMDFESHYEKYRRSREDEKREKKREWERNESNRGLWIKNNNQMMEGERVGEGRRGDRRGSVDRPRYLKKISLSKIKIVVNEPL